MRRSARRALSTLVTAATTSKNFTGKILLIYR